MNFSSLSNVSFICVNLGEDDDTKHILSCLDFVFQKWSGELATIAQNHANKCVNAHNPSASSQSASFAYVGENLYVNTGKVVILIENNYLIFIYS